ncbi:hypothetical protein DAMA08_002320 [Martiniozyma asiatica (nom. inval.)]|nr:hypothetical protein DAMA08_002320 [Martiniozyma asiatica]
MSSVDYPSYTIDSIDSKNDPIVREPQYLAKGIQTPNESITSLAKSLKLDQHPNGGYFLETDRLSPILFGDKVRSPSTSIHYLMSCKSPIGPFHKNVTGRSIHVLQKGKAVYVLIYPNGEIKKFTVGFDTEKGEVTQWIVPRNVWKGCYVVPCGETESDNDCLWASEVVVPGFEFEDMVMLTSEELEKLAGDEAKSLEFLIQK